MIALFREDLIQERASMAPKARGKQAMERLLRKVTAAELSFELELEAALMESLARDPDFGIHGGLV